MTNNKDNNFHAGHRERLRTRYLENGISSMADHEILEFLLFHTIPRVDTKNKAYELIKHFGGLSNMLCASVDALMEAGLTRNSAAHIKFVADLNKLVNHRGCDDLYILSIEKNLLQAHLTCEKRQILHDVDLFASVGKKHRILQSRVSATDNRNRFSAEECAVTNCAK